MIRHSRLATFALTILSVVCTVAATEGLLSWLAPFPLNVTGYVHSDNGQRYGWGFAPNQLIRVVDPDTGADHLDRVNRRGWRDIDHPDNRAVGRLRILLLGDSHMFGWIVGRRNTPRNALKRALAARGIDAEVISISQPSWGTDQEYQAFLDQGRKLAADFVVLHVDQNDLSDNLWHEDGGKWGRRKPFFYEVESDGTVAHRDNPRFEREWDAITRRRIIASSEILKRAWSLRLALKDHEKPEKQILPAQIEALDQSVGRRAEAFLTRLKEMINRQVTTPEIDRLAAAAGVTDLAPVVNRMAAHWRLFREWSPSGYLSPSLPSTDEQWRLLTGLIGALAHKTRNAGGRLLLSIDREIGRYRWNVGAGRIKPSAETKARFLAGMDPLRRFAEKARIAVIPHKRPLLRADMDFHMTAEGNANWAANVADYLTGIRARK